MRAVAEVHHLTTSTVSQQIAALARETGAQLIEPEGRRVRLTPAGQRLADHAVTILAAVESARVDLDPDAEPAGTVRVGGFATGIRVSLLPIVADLAKRYPKVEFVISEYEPIEAFKLLSNDDLDLALTYDYNLAPASPGAGLQTVPLWSVEWGLAVPARVHRHRRRHRRRMRIRRGSSTLATPLTKTPCAPWLRWLDSPRRSPTRSTASTWWRI